MLPLRLGCHALPPTDVELVRMLLRLYGLQEKFQWTYAELPPFDAVLVDYSMVPAASPADTNSAHHVLRLTGANDSASENTLSRPVCSEKLRCWLDSVGQALALRPAHPSSGIPAATPLEKAPQPEIKATTSAAVPLATNQVLLPSDNAPRFSLRRWPRKGILRNDPSRIRMATLLSRRALNARDLVTLTGLDPHQCEVFMQTLHASSLLQPAGSAVTTQAIDRALDTAQPSHAAKPSFTRGLISGLRKRLGLE